MCLPTRIKQIAATGVDGIWLDVPLFSELGAAWPDAGPGAAAKFQADTGLQVPRRVDWDDPMWRRWIAWRYQEISSFLLRVRDAARSVSNDVSIIVETVTLDYGLATLVGLDGSILKMPPNIIQAWEVDAVSDQTAMREAQPDDWISLIGMAKFAKAASGRKPSWMFVYGDRPDDSLLVMAEALAAGNNPFETKTPKMTTTAGASYRRQIYGWVKQEERRLFESAPPRRSRSTSHRRAAITSTRPRGPVSTPSPARTTCSGGRTCRTTASICSTYLAEYRGIIKWLVHNHVPFDIVVRPQAEELSRYDAVIAPALAALSDQAAELLDRYVERGGHLVVTGPDPGTLDEFGNPRAAPILGSLDGRERPRQVGGDRNARAARDGVALAAMAGEIVSDVHLARRERGDRRTARHAPATFPRNGCQRQCSHRGSHARRRDARAPDQSRAPLEQAGARAARGRREPRAPAGPHGLGRAGDVTGAAVENTARGDATAVQHERKPGVFKVPLRAYSMVIVSTRP